MNDYGQFLYFLPNDALFKSHYNVPTYFLLQKISFQRIFMSERSSKKDDGFWKIMRI